ncbi:uncharacterized protein LOC142496148 [Ascaphus truei]|uniref:uncharacterized protein LOC142496148 n=1 Tax=Ascaphus truei TaxID=8439 RepID=UPI003F59BAB4
MERLRAVLTPKHRSVRKRASKPWEELSRAWMVFTISAFETTVWDKCSDGSNPWTDWCTAWDKFESSGKKPPKTCKQTAAVWREVRQIAKRTLEEFGASEKKIKDLEGQIREKEKVYQDCQSVCRTLGHGMLSVSQQLETSKQQELLMRRKEQECQRECEMLKDTIKCINQQLQESKKQELLMRRKEQECQRECEMLKDTNKCINQQLQESKKQELLMRRKEQECQRECEMLKDTIKCINQQLQESKKQELLMRRKEQECQRECEMLKDTNECINQQLQESKKQELLMRRKEQDCQRECEMLKDTNECINQQLQESKKQELLMRRKEQDCQRECEMLKDKNKCINQQLQESKKQEAASKAEAIQFKSKHARREEFVKLLLEATTRLTVFQVRKIAEEMGPVTAENLMEWLYKWEQAMKVKNWTTKELSRVLTQCMDPSMFSLLPKKVQWGELPWLQVCQDIVGCLMPGKDLREILYGEEMSEEESVTQYLDRVWMEYRIFKQTDHVTREDADYKQIICDGLDPDLKDLSDVPISAAMNYDFIRDFAYIAHGSWLENMENDMELHWYPRARRAGYGCPSRRNIWYRLYKYEDPRQTVNNAPYWKLVVRLSQFEELGTEEPRCTTHDNWGSY